MKLSATQIRYLLVIYELSVEGKIQSNVIAEKMNVTKPSVHRMLGQLAKMKLITKEKYSYVLLSRLGTDTALEYTNHLNRISKYFINSMCISEDTARESAITLLGELEEEKALEINNMILQLSPKV